MRKNKLLLQALKERIEQAEKEILNLQEQINLLGIRSNEIPSFKEIIDEWTNGAKK